MIVRIYLVEGVCCAGLQYFAMCIQLAIRHDELKHSFFNRKNWNINRQLWCMRSYWETGYNQTVYIGI